jgi:hypothetical protein
MSVLLAMVRTFLAYDNVLPSQEDFHHLRDIFP